MHIIFGEIICPAFTSCLGRLFPADLQFDSLGSRWAAFGLRGFPLQVSEFTILIRLRALYFSLACRTGLRHSIRRVPFVRRYVNVAVARACMLRTQGTPALAFSFVSTFNDNELACYRLHCRLLAFPMCTMGHLESMRLAVLVASYLGESTLMRFRCAQVFPPLAIAWQGESTFSSVPLGILQMLPFRRVLPTRLLHLCVLTVRAPLRATCAL